MDNKGTIRDLIFSTRKELIQIILSYENDKKKLIHYLERLLKHDEFTSVCELIERIKSDKYD